MFRLLIILSWFQFDLKKVGAGRNKNLLVNFGFEVQYLKKRVRI